MSRRAGSTFLVFSALFLFMASVDAIAQNPNPPAVERFTIHSSVLNEDRQILVRMPATGPGGKNKFPVLYLLDGDGHTNEVGAIIDFLAGNNKMAPLMIVG